VLYIPLQLLAVTAINELGLMAATIARVLLHFHYSGALIGSGSGSMDSKRAISSLAALISSRHV
jgi:hypothetical protein